MWGQRLAEQQAGRAKDAWSKRQCLNFIAGRRNSIFCVVRAALGTWGQALHSEMTVVLILCLLVSRTCLWCAGRAEAARASDCESSVLEWARLSVKA